MATYTSSGRKVTASQKKRAIMAANDWTEEQYRKKYDLFKNKLRAYESFKRAHGAKVETQSPQDLLYRQAKAMKREGSGYKPSLEMRRIQSFSAVSITKGRKLAADTTSLYSRRRSEEFAATTAYAFKGLIKSSKKAAEIDRAIKDPVKKEELLKALAEYIHAKQKPTGEFEEGEVYGSDEAGDDFDFSQWEVQYELLN